MANPENKQIPYESTQKDIRDAIESVATAIGGIAIPSADHVSYDNSVSGLSATDVQNALDEIVSDIPTVNNGTLTIQQNGTSKGSFTANSASNVNVNIETPTADKKTATDQFATADGGLLSKCQINLVPVQSGSGDPYPAGGGKNKLPLTIENLKAWNTSGTWSGNTYTYLNMDFTILTDDANNVIGIEENGTTSSYPSFNVFIGTLNGSYRLCKDNARERVYANGSQVNDGTSDYSFTALGETYEIKLFTGAGTYDHQIVKPMLVLSTETDYTFAPYSNVRPISGHTEVDLYNVGKNYAKYPLIFQSAPNADMSSIKIYLPVGNYTASFDSINNATTWRFYIKAYEADGTLIKDGSLISNTNPYNEFRNDQNGWINSGNTNSKVQKFTIEKSGYYSFGLAYGDTTASTITTNFQIEKGSTATTFEPYLGHLYQVQIGSTVYGGYVDLVSGVMIATHAYERLLDSWSWNYRTGADRRFDFSYGSNIPTAINKNYTYICNQLAPVVLSLNTHEFGTFYISGGWIVIHDTNSHFADLTAFKDWLSNNQIYICYEMATPLTIQLTPQQIETLAGQNNLSTPLDGQSIETNGVEYKELFTFADVKEYVDKKIPDAPTTDGTYTLQAVVSGGVPTYSWI